MKKGIVMSVLALFIGATALLANNRDGINQKAITSFQKEYRNATEVSWQMSGQLIKVSFTLNEQAFMAFYNEAGERLAIARNLRSSDLPLSLQEELKSSYSNYWITDLFEMNMEEETAYYITIEDADHRITLKSAGFREWVHYKTKNK